MASEKEKQICKSKKRYSSTLAAQKALKLINPIRRLGKPRRIYKCSVCGGYHLSSKPA